MTYYLKNHETIPIGIKCMTSEQIEASIHNLTRTIKANRYEAIHSARKHFKKLRALMRLVRDDIGEGNYKQENACFRDAGRALSEIRDAAVRIETLDDLINYYHDSINPEQFAGIRQILVDDYDRIRASRAE